MIFLLDDACNGLLPMAKLVYNIIKILVIVIPIILIILGTIDLGKAVVASDDKEIKAAQSLLIKRVIYAAVIFFIPVLVTVIMDTVSGSTKDTDAYEVEYTENNVKKGWKECWKAVKGKTATSGSGNGSGSGSGNGAGDTEPYLNPTPA